MAENLKGNYTNSTAIGGEVTTTRVDSSDKTGIDMVLVGGSSAAGGQIGPGLVTKVEINATTPTDLTQALIDAGLTSFNAQSIQNRSGEEIEVGFASSWTYGDKWVIENNRDMNVDLTHDEHIYALSSSSTVDIKVLGLSNSGS